MTKFLVDYYETYSKSYEVEANNMEEAEEIVKNDIIEGRREEPDIVQSHGLKWKN